jgi:hypothetical protein
MNIQIAEEAKLLTKGYQKHYADHVIYGILT